jgi:hypothetical protein
MNRLLVIALFCFLTVGFRSIAQETDTALYRKLKISKIYSWVTLPLMPRKADSCKNEEKHLNRLGLITYSKTNYLCFGWSRSDETFITYDHHNRISTIKYLSKEILVSHTSYFYNDNGDVVREVRLFYDPLDTLEMNYAITYDSAFRKTSELVVSKGSKGQEPYTARYGYDSLGRMTSREIWNDAEKKMATYSFKYNAAGLLTSETFEAILPAYSYNQQLFQYDEKGILKKHVSTADNTATEFLFFPNGLLNRLYRYNRFGQMDREYITQYEYFENGN